MLIHSILLTRFLSYGPASDAVPLHALNLIIGPNGSGKSNLLEAIDLIRSAPKDLLTPLRDGGGVQHWLWKGDNETPTATIDVVVSNPQGSGNLRYVLSFTEAGQRFELADERIENEHSDKGLLTPYFYYAFQGGRAALNVKGSKRFRQREDSDLNQSSLAQRRDTVLGSLVRVVCESTPAVALVCPIFPWCQSFVDGEGPESEPRISSLILQTTVVRVTRQCSEVFAVCPCVTGADHLGIDVGLTEIQDTNDAIVGVLIDGQYFHQPALDHPREPVARGAWRRLRCTYE